MKTVDLLLLTLLLCVPTAGRSSVAGNDPTALAQRLDAELGVAVDDARRNGADVDARLLQRIESELDAGRRDWAGRGGAAEGTEKLEQLRGLLANANRYNQLRAQGTPASLPHTGLEPALAVRAVAGSLGSSCARPWDLGEGVALSTELAPAGAQGDGLWLKVAASGRTAIALSTLGSRGDVDIAVYADCGDSQPVIANDDHYGLQALAVLPQSPASYLVRVGNRDRNRPAQARIAAVLATGYAGKVVLDQTGGASVAGIVVSNFSSLNGYYTGTTTTDVSGHYTMVVGSAGSYYARTSNNQFTLSSVLHAAWPDVPCMDAYEYYSLYSCGPAQPGAITVEIGQSTSGVDFLLELGRVLTFRVVNEADGSPLAGAEVYLGSDTASVGTRLTDSVGRVSFLGLHPGVEYRASFREDGFRREIFDNIPCNDGSCDLGAGTPIVFLPADSYFREHLVGLTPARRVVVHVRDLPASSYSVNVRFLHPSGQVAYFGQAYASTATPGWRSVVFTDPPLGSYYLQAGYADASFWRLYPDVDCLDDCAALLSTAQPVVITDTPGVVEYSVEPRPFPSLHGTVTDQVSGLPVNGANAHLIPLSAGGNQGTAYISADGQYRFPYARPGSYLVAVTSPQHVDVAYPDAPCTGGYYSLVCPNATPVAIASTASQFTFDFGLTPSGRIDGRLTVEGASLPTYPTQPQMRLRRANGTLDVGVLERTAGGYSLGDIEPGQYRVIVEDSVVAYGQVYPGVDCAGASCLSQTLGQLVNVVSGPLGGIDFDLRLQRGGKGRVLDAVTGLPLAGVVVDMWSDNAAGVYYQRSGLTGADGRFALLAEGTNTIGYRLATSVGNGYINEVYNNVACPLGPAYFNLCDLGLGDVVAAVHPIDGQGITFRLTPIGAESLYADGFE